MYAFWSFAYNNVFDFLSAIYIPIISDQSKSNTLQKIKFSLSSWLSQIKKKEKFVVQQHRTNMLRNHVSKENPFNNFLLPLH